MNKTPTAPPPAKAAKLVPFLRKVQILCETCPQHVARWSADGKQFDVLDPKAFEQLLKVHFEGANPATFHRQLFFYGWVKLNYSNGGGDEKTKGTWSFRHPCFLRDDPSKIYEIKRYARASDREEQEDGSRVDVLERRVSALQSVVDDLSRKLAAMQMSLDGTGKQQQVLPQQYEPLTTSMDVVDVVKPSSQQRKRMKDIDEDFLNDELRLSEEEILQLFEEEEKQEQAKLAPSSPVSSSSSTNAAPVAPQPKASVSAAPAASVQRKDNNSHQQAQDFLSSFMSTPQFQQAVLMTSTIQDTTAAQASAQSKKVEAIPHLSVF